MAFDGSAIRIYVDGELKNSNAAPAGKKKVTNNSSIDIGYNGGTPPNDWLFDGAIDGVWFLIGL